MHDSELVHGKSAAVEQQTLKKRKRYQYIIMQGDTGEIPCVGHE